ERHDLAQELTGARLRRRHFQQVTGGQHNFASHVERNQGQVSATAEDLSGRGRVAVEMELGDGAGVARLVPGPADAHQALDQARQFRIAIDRPSTVSGPRTTTATSLGYCRTRSINSLSLECGWCSRAQGNVTPPSPPGPCRRLPS